MLDSIGGAPCERCLAAQARRVPALGREVLGPPSGGRVRVRLSPSGLPQRHRGIVAPPPRELPHPIPERAARAAAAAAVLEPAERARVAARLLDGLRALPRRDARVPAPRGPARVRS
ncbi:hypothetical protein [Amycolatopsis thermoflava]|uniref:hypothetical protein n=1 Tax=Amycolatopsis thermoflava TaxID=84480 RepID=UPI00380B9446